MLDDYLKINVSNEYIINKIHESIKNKTPFSCTRIGDGEIHILMKEKHINNQYELRQHQVIIRSILKRHNVKSNHLSFLNNFRNQLISSIKNSQYLGIPNIENFNDQWKLIYHLKIKVLNYYDIDVDKLKICDATINRSPEIGDISNFKNLINNNPIHIITSRENELKNISKIHNILNVPITYTSLNHAEGSNTERSFFQRNVLLKKIRNIKEHIILYGLGGGAKNICNVLRSDYGKCAIDMGSVLDAWSGIISRPKYNNEYSHCMIGDKKNWKKAKKK